jgi:5-methylcytosine-specific restriction endonuclease McrA
MKEFEETAAGQCGCRRKELRRLTQCNGVAIIVNQCLDCGKNCGAVAKAKISPAVGVLKEFDKVLREEYWARQQRSYLDKREAENADWWRRYESVLASPEWQAKRVKVLARCRGVCEGCGERPARHVHHLTYQRLGEEMLFDLAGVCVRCHEIIHGRPLNGSEIQYTRGAGA